MIDDNERLAGFINVDGRSYISKGAIAEFQIGDTRAIELFVKELQNSSGNLVVTLLPQSRYRAKVTLEEI